MAAIAGKKYSARSRLEFARMAADELCRDYESRTGQHRTASAALSAIAVGLLGEEFRIASQPRQVEAILARLGLTYDPYWDTDEWVSGERGVAASRAFSRMWCAARGVPRCFLINVSDGQTGSQWETDPTTHYRYDNRVTGRLPLNQAGPGSRVVYYATSSASVSPMHFVASARVAYILGGSDGPWDARLVDYTPFSRPVAVSELELPGWNRQHAITEIAPATFDALVEAGEGVPIHDRPRSTVSDSGSAVILIEEGEPAEVLSKLMADFPAEKQATALFVPEPADAHAGELSAAMHRVYSEGIAGAQETASVPSSNRSENPARDKVAEVRAVEIAIHSLTLAGWCLVRDCQQDGVGYDLEFARGERILKVEVKGIQGSRLDFNLTPKERWRAATDRDWVLVAVLKVLSPRAFEAVVVLGDRVANAPTVVTGYRVHLE